MKHKRLPVMSAMCATCPFRPDSPHREFFVPLAYSAMTDASRICHSTGVNDLYQSGKPERLCRGARNLQLKLWAKSGFISAATDRAWDAKCREIGI